MHGILAQLGEHLPYKQRGTGSSPIGSIQCEAIRIYAFAGIEECRRGGTGRRAGLKILLWKHSIGSIPIAGIQNKICVCSSAG